MIRKRRETSISLPSPRSHWNRHLSIFKDISRRSFFLSKQRNMLKAIYLRTHQLLSSPIPQPLYHVCIIALLIVTYCTSSMLLSSRREGDNFIPTLLTNSCSSFGGRGKEERASREGTLQPQHSKTPRVISVRARVGAPSRWHSRSKD